MSDKQFRVERPSMPPKGCQFTFEGGPRDGQVVKCDAGTTSSSANMSEAESYWFLTRGGEVGRAFRGMSPGYFDALQNAERITLEDGREAIKGLGPAQMHRYEVVRKEIRGETAYIKCVYQHSPE